MIRLPAHCELVRESPGRLRCARCGRGLATRADPDQVLRRCGEAIAAPTNDPRQLRPEEIAELLPDEDPSLIGNRLAALTSALGIPPCGGCTARRRWLNRAHRWLRGESA